MARTSTTPSPPRRGRVKKYDAFAAATAYGPGDVLQFAQVRQWHDKGQLVEAYERSRERTPHRRENLRFRLELADT